MMQLDSLMLSTQELAIYDTVFKTLIASIQSLKFQTSIQWGISGIFIIAQFGVNVLMYLYSRKKLNINKNDEKPEGKNVTRLFITVYTILSIAFLIFIKMFLGNIGVLITFILLIGIFSIIYYKDVLFRRVDYKLPVGFMGINTILLIFSLFILTILPQMTRYDEAAAAAILDKFNKEFLNERIKDKKSK